jgi:hypothetical protein
MYREFYMTDEEKYAGDPMLYDGGSLDDDMRLFGTLMPLLCHTNHSNR